MLATCSFAHHQKIVNLYPPTHLHLCTWPKKLSLVLILKFLKVLNSEHWQEVCWCYPLAPLHMTKKIGLVFILKFLKVLNSELGQEVCWCYPPASLHVTRKIGLVLILRFLKVLNSELGENYVDVIHLHLCMWLKK